MPRRLVFDTLNHINYSRATMQQCANTVATRRKGVLGVHADKISALKFLSLNELQMGYAAMTTARRKWREHGVELDAFKKLELTFDEYVVQLRDRSNERKDRRGRSTSGIQELESR